jgi:hypothetical protein
MDDSEQSQLIAEKLKANIADKVMNARTAMGWAEDQDDKDDEGAIAGS